MYLSLWCKPGRWTLNTCGENIFTWLTYIRRRAGGHMRLQVPNQINSQVSSTSRSWLRSSVSPHLCHSVTSRALASLLLDSLLAVIKQQQVGKSQTWPHSEQLVSPQRAPNCLNWSLSRRLWSRAVRRWWWAVRGLASTTAGSRRAAAQTAAAAAASNKQQQQQQQEQEKSNLFQQSHARCPVTLAGPLFFWREQLCGLWRLCEQLATTPGPHPATWHPTTTPGHHLHLPTLSFLTLNENILNKQKTTPEKQTKKRTLLCTLRT